MKTKATQLNLESILECLDSIPNINHGGCGISALAIYRWCKANGVKVSKRPFVILLSESYGDKWTIEHNRDIIEMGDFRRITLSHVAIKVGKKLIDSTGQPDLDYYKHRQPEQLNESELIEALDSSWNHMFDREESIPKIELALNIDLSDVLAQGR